MAWTSSSGALAAFLSRFARPSPAALTAGAPGAPAEPRPRDEGPARRELPRVRASRVSDTTSFFTRFEGGSVALFSATFDGEILACTPEFARLFGFADRRSPRGQQWTHLLAEPAQARELYAQLKERGVLRDVELSLKRQGGEPFWGLAQLALPGWPASEARTFEAAIFDITERKRRELDALERMLRHSEGEALYRSFFDKIPVGIFVTDAKGNGLFVNRRWCAMTGMNPHEIQGDGWTRILHPDDADEAFRKWLEATSAGREFNAEYRFKALDGRVLWVSAIATALQDESGEVTGYIGYNSDITERRQFEQILKESEASIRSLHSIAAAQDLSFTEKVQALLALGCQVFGLAVGVFGQLQMGRGQVVEARSPGGCVPKGSAFVFDSALLRTYFSANGPATWTRTAEDPLPPIDVGIPIEVFFGTPIRVAGRSQGILWFAHGEPRPGFRPTELEFLRLMALWIGSELEREQRNREIVLLSELGDLLQSCGSLPEAYEVISRQARKLFPDCSGTVYLTAPSRTDLDATACWSRDGSPASAEPCRPEECWALRRGREHLVVDPDTDLPCRHVHFTEGLASLCVPMLALGETLGIFHLASDGGPSGVRSEGVRRLASAVAEHLGMAIANLNLRETLRQQSIRDPLTGLFNRRYFEESLDREVRRARRHSSNLGVIMLDLDHFKRFNDTFGHEAGDLMLRVFGDFLRSRVRGEDVACRFGGEEFAVIMPEASLDNVKRRAEDLRRAAHDLQVTYRDNLLGMVTVSLGVANYPEHGSNGMDVLRAADAALYRSKGDGRDRVTVAAE